MYIERKMGGQYSVFEVKGNIDASVLESPDVKIRRQPNQSLLLRKQQQFHPDQKKKK